MIESFKRMMQASGGWVYHRRHLMNKHRWKDFKTGIGCWLEAQIPPQNDLILIGSSAGYNLTNSFLINFQQLRVVEIDPLSPWFWKLNHKLPVQNWSTKNFFGRSPVLDPECFQKIRAAYPQSPLLFCNLLGAARIFVRN